MFLLSSLFALTLTANADRSQFTILGYKQCAPFEGVLLSKQATAEVLSGYDRFLPACDNRVRYELGKQEEKHRLELETLNIEHNARTKEYDLFIKHKDREIEAFIKSLKKTSPRNKTWWFIGGVVAGTAATYGAYRLFDER
tara:strand:+ start:282 stop:704 length:423 start_codon:yes stop_codon:yes gene_type:complete